MDTGRDLACPALWQESLERSLARRGRPTRSSAELFHLRAERDLSRSEDVLLRSQIEEISATGKSLMPDGLESQLSKQDLADLIDYLLSAVR